MRIDRVRVGLVSQSNRDKDWRKGLPKLAGQGGLILEVSAEGLSGVGYATEAPYTGELLDGMRQVVHQIVQPMLDGCDPLRVPQLMDRLDVAVLGYPRVKAAVEVALLDLVAKTGGLPMYALLGGLYRESIPIIRIVSIKPPSEMADAAERMVATGYRYLKLKMGHDGTDAARVRAVRSAVGPDVTLTLDPSGEWSAKQAIAAMRTMEDLDIALVEQPVRAGDDAGMGVVRHAVAAIVEADESADSLAAIYRVASAGCADAVALKTPKLGGPSNVLRAAAVCRAANIGCRISKSGESRLSALTDMHAIAAIPNIDFACEIGEFARMASDPTDGVEIVNGTLSVTHVPGHGATLRDDAFLE